MQRLPIALLVLTAGLYLRGIRAVWTRAGRGRVVSARRAWCFAGALVALVAALAPPLDAIADDLFSAHMGQHLLLMMVAAPLMAASDPLLVTLWALPLAWRRSIGRHWTQARRARAAWKALCTPAIVWLLHVVTLWIWHLPSLYERALRHELLHALEHATFFLSALLFWWLLLRRHGRRMGAGVAIAYLFTAGLQSTMLGAFLTMSRRPWYPSHYTTTQAWGLTPLEDQQLAGLLMWVPAGLVYLIPLVALIVRVLSEQHVRLAPQGLVPPAAAGVSARGTP